MTFLQGLVFTIAYGLLAVACGWYGCALRDGWVKRKQLDGEREAHEALKAQSIELQAKRAAMPEPRRIPFHHPNDAPDWPAHVEHPLADPATETAAIPTVPPGRHAR